jgi:NADH-quinone oxidoreductase subunit J
VLLHAEFLAAVQVLLYAGGVVTIVVFAIMLTERLVGDSIRQTNRGILAGAAMAAAVFVGLAGTILRATRPGIPPVPELTTAALGRAVLTEWVPRLRGARHSSWWPALLGALYLARTEE